LCRRRQRRHFLSEAVHEYTADDFRALVSTNLTGFIYVTQLAVKQMQAQKTGGSIVSITAALVDNPLPAYPLLFYDSLKVVWTQD
jgi:NAD(P)-dependent dehydrogenase (short-subunit alcohol dehydrogenase family)